MYTVYRRYKVWFSIYSSVGDTLVFLSGQTCDSINVACEPAYFLLRRETDAASV